MRKMSERRKVELRGKMQVIRTKLVDTILAENKKGNAALCNPKRPLMDRKEYCKKLPPS